MPGMSALVPGLINHRIILYFIYYIIWYYIILYYITRVL